MKSIADIKAIRDKKRAEMVIRDNSDSSTEKRIVIGMSTCGIEAGALNVFNAFVDEISTREIKGTRITRSGSLNMGDLNPVVEVIVPGENKVTYVNVDEAKAKKIVVEHIVGGNVIKEYLAK